LVGGSKFIANRSSATHKAIRSLADHIDGGLLTERKALIGPKIPRSHPQFDRLQWLFHPDTNLDEIISRLVVPVFIASDTKTTTCGYLPDNYGSNVENELEEIRTKILARYETQLRLIFVYVPLNDKAAFDADLTARLAAFS
jgi:hypothetical protein